uniref:Alpha-amylase n=1 Tax=Zabrotes subfasciatus TaxID=122865 RepID=Q9N2P9_ZABSU|nr:alpha amylase [Zabrotes subfasciatus]
MKLGVVQLILGLAVGFTQKNSNFQPGRNSIVQMFEWNWGNLAKECETFLGPKGFAGIQISPPNENVVVGDEGRPWWERYQPLSYQLTTRSGDEGALADMIKRCNNAGVRVYADVVFNHMAAKGGSGTGGNNCDPSKKSYPAVPYGPDDFHPDCMINNYQDVNNVRNCQLVGLPDLDQSKQYVRDKIVGYLNHLVDLGIAGFRVDAAKHMWPADLSAIYGSVKNLNSAYFPGGSRPLFYQEVIDYGTEPIKKGEYTGFGRVLDFVHGGQLTNVFRGQNQLKNLQSWGTSWGLASGSDTVVFIDNHDTQRDNGRVLTYKEAKQYKMANAFMLAHPYAEIPKLFSGYYFNDNKQGPPGQDNICAEGSGWVCEHRWRQIANMVGFRNAVSGTDMTNWWTDGYQQIAFGRGNKGFVAFSLSGDIKADLQTSLPPGTYCDVITGDISNNSCTGKTVTVRGDGKATIHLSSGEPDGILAIHVSAKLTSKL